MMVPSSPQAGWTILHTKNSLMLDGDVPEPRPEPLTAGAKSWPPGTRFIFLGGSKTSAAFEWIDFRQHKPAEYVGMVDAIINDSEPGPVAVFKQEAFNQDDGRPQLFGWNYDGDCLFWGNHTLNLRMIELDRATVEGQEVPRHARGGKVGGKNGRRGHRDQRWPEFHICPECWHVQRFPTAQPFPLCCSACGAAECDRHSSMYTGERAIFDALQAGYGDAADFTPPAPIEQSL